MKVFVVTSGHYSDYSIEAMFSTEEKANEFIEKWGDLSSIEEWDIDKYHNEVGYLRVTMSITGDSSIGCHSHTGSPHKESLDGSGFGCYIPFTDPTKFTYWVHTDDEERAIKVANEKRTLILVADVWGDREKTIQLLGSTNEGSDANGS